MHGMLSAAVMLAAFAVIALAAAASVVWLYRATGAYAQRSRPAPAGRAGDAAVTGPIGTADSFDGPVGSPSRPLSLDLPQAYTCRSKQAKLFLKLW